MRDVAWLCLCLPILCVGAVRLQSPKDERPRTLLRPKAPVLRVPTRAAPRFVVPPPPYSVKLVWNPSPGTNVAGYRVYYGVASRTYTNAPNVGNVTNATISQLYGLTNSSVTYFFAVTAYDTSGLESDYSNEVSVKKLDTIVTVSAGTNSLVLTNPPAISQFYRLRGLSWTSAEVLAAGSLRGPWSRVSVWGYASNAVPPLSVAVTRL